MSDIRFGPPGKELADESSHHKEASTVCPQDEQVEDISSLLCVT
jgi:hypothetical protein